MINIMKYLLSFNMLLVVIISVQAQEMRTTNSNICIDASAGLGGRLNDIAVTASGDVRVNLNNQFISGQALLMGGVTNTEGEPQERLFAFNILYGRTHPFHLNRQLFPMFPLSLLFNSETDYVFSGAIGVGIVRSVIKGQLLSQYHFVNQVDGIEGVESVYAYDPTISIGVPFQVEITQLGNGSVGYVHRLYCNLNSRRTVWGLVWGIQVFI
jgi:hypothetical protein